MTEPATRARHTTATTYSSGMPSRRPARALATASDEVSQPRRVSTPLAPVPSRTGSAGGHRDGGEHLGEHVGGSAPGQLGFGRQAEPVLEDRSDQRFDVVGYHVLASH